MTELLARYEAGVAGGEFQEDEAQIVALRLLQSLHEELSRDDEPPKNGFLSRLFGKSQPVKTVRGLYFWGGVGRGKTFLMDLFYEELEIPRKKRLHFHRFMREVHRQLRDFQGEPDPLKKIASRFSDEAKVICFDEFFVSDITDAMLLAGLFEEMFRLGMTLVATSNVEPDHLYENGLQRRKFLPAIELIKTHTRVHNLDSGVDYRLRALESAEIYHYPLDAAAEQGLDSAFYSISPDAGKPQIVLSIEGRDIQTRRCGDGVAWFDFEAICDGPRSQNDYIELARLFQTVLIGKVPLFTENREDQARRFIGLVDEFYDRNVKLIISAATRIVDLYQGERLGFEFQRTESRLQEMQSHDYLAREHRP
ncbi:MAG: cell division protein ZapE [Gammaproteobacteria bacterium]|jgi:cell division protein ZapE|nr:cell division protein ZapE [Gammaproteobacteria bacterium]MBT4494268.1 cell division protein ZapE [Gammaproteobacteria bacterium]